MKQVIDTSERVQRFNEDEAVWRCFEHKRALRRLLGPELRLSEALLDDLDWLEAAHECRQVRAIGVIISLQP